MKKLSITAIMLIILMSCQTTDTKFVGQWMVVNVSSENPELDNVVNFSYANKDILSIKRLEGSNESYIIEGQIPVMDEDYSSAYAVINGGVRMDPNGARRGNHLFHPIGNNQLGGTDNPDITVTYESSGQLRIEYKLNAFLEREFKMSNITVRLKKL